VVVVAWPPMLVDASELVRLAMKSGNESNNTKKIAESDLQAAITLLLAERSAESLLLSVMSNDPLHNDDVSVGASNVAQ
jgi:hypothetical protein